MINFITQTGRNIAIQVEDGEVVIRANGERLSALVSKMITTDGMIDAGIHRIGGKRINILIPIPADQLAAVRELCAQREARVAEAHEANMDYHKHVARVRKAMNI